MVRRLPALVEVRSAIVEWKSVLCPGYRFSLRHKSTIHCKTAQIRVDLYISDETSRKKGGSKQCSVVIGIWVRAKHLSALGLLNRGRSDGASLFGISQGC